MQKKYIKPYFYLGRAKLDVVLYIIIILWCDRYPVIMVTYNKIFLKCSIEYNVIKYNNRIKYNNSNIIIKYNIK